MSVFDDKINDYSNGASGTLTTPAGQSVGYSVASNASTRDWGDVVGGAQINQSSGWVEVSFDAPVHNAAIHISSSNVGEAYLVEVDGQPVDLNTMIAAGGATFHSFGGNQIVNADGQLTATGSWTGMDTAVLQFHVPVSSLKVSGDGSGGGWDIFDVGLAGASLPCFCAGTMIATPTGSVRVEALRAGDLVLTLDHGAQPVLWAGSRDVSLSEQIVNPRKRPVRVARGALGEGQPRHSLSLSRQHRVLLTRADGTERLVPVAKLLECPGVEVSPPRHAVTFHHLLFARHEIVQADGLACESLFWGERSQLLFPEVVRVLPLEVRLGLLGSAPARRLLDTRRALRDWLGEAIVE